MVPANPGRRGTSAVKPEREREREREHTPTMSDMKHFGVIFL